MNVHKLLDDLVFIQIQKQKFNVGKNCERFPVTNNYIGLDYIFSNSFLKSYTKNFIQLHTIGSSAILHNLKLSQDEIQVCNEQGLEIFLTEQAYFQCGPGDSLPVADFVNLNFDMEFDKYPIYWQTCNYNIKSLELDSCKKFIQNNTLTKVTVHIVNKDIKNLLAHYNLDIQNKNPFLQAIFQILKTVQRRLPPKELIRYKFWCGNWRYEPHRHLIAAYLSNFETKLGWHFNGDAKSIEHFYWFSLDEWKSLFPQYYEKIILGIENLNKHHYFMDIKPKKFQLQNNLLDVALRPVENGEHPDWQEQISKNLYNDTFCSIVNLGTFADYFPAYDEKPLCAIRNFRPFVLVGPPGSLQMMKDDGFKTFDKFWDESYDAETDHQKRFIKIFQVIEFINRLDINECQDLYEEMSDILLHNYKIISQGYRIV